jgi:4-amino-4-deoxy-L-arabinose transferase-like glycosyltransferase
MLDRPAVHVGALVLIALVLFLARAATIPLDGDPAMYATIAKTIVATGEWTHLTFNGEPYLNKPPLHFWLNALVFHVLPPTAFTAALVPGLLGVLDVILLYVVCRVTFADWRIAFTAALVYLTTPEVVHWSRGVHLETLVTAWVLLGLLAAYRSVADPSALLLLAVAAAGGWLAKGPQGLFPVAVAIVLWARERVLLQRVLSPWAAAAAAIVAVAVGPWLAARLGEGSGFAAVYFGEQIGGVLFESGEMDRGALWYVGKLLRTYWPWLPVAVVGGVLLARQWRSSLGARMWLVYAAIVLVVISVAGVKKSRYLFQLYPALAAASGYALVTLAGRHANRLGWLLVPAAVSAVLVATIGGERASAAQAAHSAEALEIARRVSEPAAEGTRVWITRRGQDGDPGFGKIVGFYAQPVLHTCRTACGEEAMPGDRIIARAGEADDVAAAAGGRVVHRNPSLAVVTVDARRSPRFR